MRRTAGRRMRAPASLALVALVAGPLIGRPAQAQVRDPSLPFSTIRTEHFVIHYHEPLALVARRVAAVAERAQALLAGPLGYAPEGRTQVVLTDVSDGANGSATALPYNAMRLFVTAPDDLSALGDYDDWLTVLVVHEHTHVLHLDNIHGLPSIINGTFGKIYAPNSAQPRWVTEGLATYEESRRSSGGRLRSSLFEMYMRMDALEGRLLDIDTLSNVPDRWPHGSAWYLYGSRFIRFIVDRYGEDVLAEISDEYGKGPLPYGLNRVALRTTGHTFIELYREFLADQRTRQHRVADRVRAAGLRAGTQLTHHGEDARAPRFLDAHTVVYSMSDGRHEAQLRAVDARTGGRQRELERLAGLGYGAPAPDGRHLYYATTDAYHSVYFFFDLFRLDTHTGRSKRLTHGLRARYPDVSPDGRRIVFSVDNAGTSHLMIADTDDIEGTRRVLYRSERFEQAYTPRFSPDGRQVAFSDWREGGYRDIRVIDLDSGQIRDVTHDRAQDTGPVWSPDGRYLYFSSDRTGIANIYRYDLHDGELRQITNVIGGAYQPAISPDGQRLVYLGYSSFGWDLWGMDLDPATFEPAAPYVDTRPAPSPSRDTVVAEATPYNPLPTLLPHNYAIEVKSGAFGTEVGIAVAGSDVVGFNSYTASLAIPVERGDVNVDFAYSFRRLPTTLSLHAYRLVRPRGDLVVGGAPRQWIADLFGAELGASRSFPRRFHSNFVSATFGVSYTGKAEPFSGRLDPNTPPPVLPELGRNTNLRLGWSYSDVQRQTYDISPSAGRALSASVTLRDPVLGSAYQSVTFQWAAVQYIENPWVEHHVLALRYGGGISLGEAGRRAVFAMGGFPTQSLEDVVLNDARLGGVYLRGYTPFSRFGTQFHLLQAEYRFPIARPQWGVATLPFYVTRIHGAVFTDYGNAFFGPIDFHRFRVGIGAELLTDLVFGYFVNVTLRTGVAYGFDQGGGLQFYANLGFPF